MKALINIAHGEGFGLPLFEAACNGLPLVTITWSGQMDFICKKNKKGKQVPKVSRVDYDIGLVQESAVWPGVINKDAMWAFPRQTSYKRACREILKKEKHFQKEAKILQTHILKNFSEEIIYKQFVDVVLGSPEADDDHELDVLEFG
jgi:glycosyltransferase involved in cell wall biosynthesis